ncbi:MAG: recombination-associated protein RdgC [Motiliproteus sp.]|nr:recombination-associated protein RdgC [Motiliproteus sp.]MCW9054177.1 recombination-associated protein RdgC [Motiliproteus sp.]
MWFKNLVFYRFTRSVELEAEKLHETLLLQRFVPCRSQEASRYGWCAPMGKPSDQLVHASNGYLLICARKEEKILPASVVKDELSERVEEIEQSQDRKVRKKERDQLKDDITFELLPKAFSRYQQTYAYIDPKNGLLIIDASSAKRAEELCSFLRKTLGSLPVMIPKLNNAPASVMTQWLLDKNTQPSELELGFEAELKDPSEDGAVLRCKQQDLLSEEIAAHLNSGKQVVKIAASYQDSFSCLIADDLIIRRLKFSDKVLDKASELGEADAAAAFDADFSLMTLELARFIPQLIDYLGGEQPQETLA